MPHPGRGVLVVGATLLLAVPDTASASLPYSLTVRDELGLAADPGCTLCHQDDKGGDGTATKPFGELIQAYGAVGDDLGSLLYALDEMEHYEADGDQDGAHDLDELRQGTNPNDGTDPPPPPTSPGQGGDDGMEASNSSTDSSSAAGGTAALETSGAGGTVAARPPPPRRNSLAPEMKTGCALGAGSDATGAGPLLLFVSLVGAAFSRLRPTR